MKLTAVSTVTINPNIWTNFSGWGLYLRLHGAVVCALYSPSIQISVVGQVSFTLRLVDFRVTRIST